MCCCKLWKQAINSVLGRLWAGAGSAWAFQSPRCRVRHPVCRHSLLCLTGKDPLSSGPLESTMVTSVWDQMLCCKSAFKGGKKKGNRKTSMFLHWSSSLAIVKEMFWIAIDKAVLIRSVYFPTSEFLFKRVLGKCYSVALLENNNLTFFPSLYSDKYWSWWVLRE